MLFKKSISFIITSILIFSLMSFVSVSVFAVGNNDWPDPSKHVTVYVPHGVGGATDLQTRLLTNEMKEYLGIEFVVLNRPEGDGNLGRNLAANAPADGYTITGDCAISEFIATTKHENTDYRPEDFTTIGSINVDPSFFLCLPDKFESIYDLIETAKERKLTVAATGLYGGDAYNIWMMAEALGIKDRIEIVPYNSGAEAHAALMGGHVDFRMRSGGHYNDHPDVVRLLVVAWDERWPGLEDVPTVEEVAGNKLVLPGGMRGLFIKKDTPPEIIEKFREAFEYAISKEYIKERWEDTGFAYKLLLADDFQKARLDIHEQMFKNREIFMGKD